MSAWMVYLWTRADTVASIAGLLAFITGVIGFLCFFCSVYESEQGDEDYALQMKKVSKKFISVFIITLILAIMMPSKKDIAMIYVIPKMANSQTFKELSDSTPEITKLALEALKETLQGMTKKEESK